MPVIQLQDSALFAVATALFQAEVQKYNIIYCWETVTNDVIESISFIYPYLPPVVEKTIVKTISTIGSELTCLERTLKNVYLSSNIILEPLSFSKICWTPYFTIDRLKTITNLSAECVTENNSTYPTWIKEYWSFLDENERLNISIYFEEFSLFVFFHWFCYSHLHYCLVNNVHRTRFGRRNNHDTLPYYYFTQNHDYYSDNTAIENVFRYSVMMCDMYSVTRFFCMLPLEVRDKNAFDMATLLINRCDSFGHHVRSKAEVVLTFLYLWQNLSLSNKMNIVQTHFHMFLKFLLSFPGTDPLVDFLNRYLPSGSKKINRRFLEKAAAEISSDCLE